MALIDPSDSCENEVGRPHSVHRVYCGDGHWDPRQRLREVTSPLQIVGAVKVFDVLLGSPEVQARRNVWFVLAVPRPQRLEGFDHVADEGVHFVSAVNNLRNRAMDSHV